MFQGKAYLVWDGGSTVNVPPPVGEPHSGQMKGTTGEQLIEVCTRLCYDSMGLDAGGQPKGRDSADTIKNVMDVYHGCYDAETDVLTADGWKPWPEVTREDRLATRTAHGKLEYHKPLRLISYQHKGRMYRVESRGVDLLVTPDHKMLACLTTTREGRKKHDAYYELITAEKLGQRSHAYVKTAEWAGGDGHGIPRSVWALLGFAVGDGHLARDGEKMDSTLRFHLRRSRKIVWLRKTCEAAGLKLTECAHDTFLVKLGPHAEMFTGIYDEEREKQLPQGIFTSADRPALEAVFEGLMESDGHRGATGDCFDTTSAKLVGQVQQLALHIGLAANVCYTDEDRTTSYGDKPLTRLSIIRRELRPEVNKFIDGVGRTYWVEEWEGDVYCAEVPNNTLYVRRNGRTVWSGNSVLEHYVRTIQFPYGFGGGSEFVFLNRPGVFVRQYEDDLRVTLNARAVVEWDRWTKFLDAEHGSFNVDEANECGRQLTALWSGLCPLVVKPIDGNDYSAEDGVHVYDERGDRGAWLVEPETDAEKHITLYLVGSRGFSHEMVRHRFAMSQRSTRYCEEGESKWHLHPLIEKFIAEHPHVPVFADLLHGTQKAAQDTYSSICDELQEWLAKKLPVDMPYRKKHARKQARGAARGFLGNALETQMCFTAPVWAWRHIVNMRAADAADAEIRTVISDAVPCLKASRYGDRFADLVLVPASDGMGMALQGGGHK